MAISANAVWEVESGGSDTKGGGFDPSIATGVSDLAATSGTGNSPVVTSATYTFVAGDVGAWLFVKSGTNWTPGWYKISSVSAGAATVNAAVGAAVLYSSFTLNTVAGIATVASPTSGTGSVDYSQQTSAELALTGESTSTTTVTTLTAAFTQVMVGNAMYLSGTGITTGWYFMTAYTSSTVCTIDRSAGTTGTNVTVNLGGALLTIGNAAGIVVAGNTTYIKSGTSYNESPSFTTTAGTSPSPITWIGYTTTRGDNGQATIDGQNTRTQCCTINKSWNIFKNLILTGAVTRCVDFTAAPTGTVSWYNCQLLKGAGAAGVGIDSSSFVTTGCVLFNCLLNGFATNAAKFFSGGAQAEGCQIISCGPIGTNSFSNQLSFLRCLFNGGAGPAVQVQGNFGNFTMDSCTVQGKTGGSGLQFSATTYTNCRVTNNIFASNGAYGLDAPIEAGIFADYNAYYNNTSGARHTILAGAHDVTLTADPFTNASGGDFSLNNTAGGGAACRAAGFPGVFPGGTTTGFLDIGAAQSQAVAGGGLLVFRPTILM